MHTNQAAFHYSFKAYVREDDTCRSGIYLHAGKGSFANGSWPKAEIKGFLP